MSSREDRRVYAEACVSACEARGRPDDALPILTTVAQDADSRLEDAAWARRTLAVLTAALGSRDGKREVIEPAGHHPRDD
jgi:hypothetical protein